MCRVTCLLRRRIREFERRGGSHRLAGSVLQRLPRGDLQPHRHGACIAYILRESTDVRRLGIVAQAPRMLGVPAARKVFHPLYCTGHIHAAAARVKHHAHTRRNPATTNLCAEGGSHQYGHDRPASSSRSISRTASIRTSITTVATSRGLVLRASFKALSVLSAPEETSVCLTRLLRIRVQRT